MKITRGARLTRHRNLNTTIQPERHGGHRRKPTAGVTGIGEGGRRGTRWSSARGPADRTGSALHRKVVAGHVAIILLPAGSREDCMRWGGAGSGTVGPQRQGARIAGPRGSRRHGAQLLANVTNTAGIIPGVTNRMTYRERGAGDDRGGISRVPHGCGGHTGQHYVQHGAKRLKRNV